MMSNYFFFYYSGRFRNLLGFFTHKYICFRFHHVIFKLFLFRVTRFNHVAENIIYISMMDIEYKRNQNSFSRGRFNNIF